MKEVHWKSLLTGYEGHGEPVEDHIAEKWVEEGNIKHSKTYHWTVKVWGEKT